MRILHPGRFCGTPLCHPMFHGGHLARWRCDTTLMPFDSAKCSPLSRPPTAQRCEPETGREQDFSLFKLVFGARLLRRNMPILSRYAREKWRFSSGFQLDHFRHMPCALCAAVALFCGNNTSAAKNLTRGIFDHFSAPISCLFWQNLENLWVTLCEGFGERIDKVSKMFPNVVCSSLATRHWSLPLATSSPALQSPASPARRRAGVPPIL